ncbi:hypothetical protein BGX23_012139 [Mortierella sp. AD031]|nr:hypothetical protein BGX23_012139 [Mortierella sp. AD031]
MSMLRLQGIQRCINITRRVGIHQRFISEALLREEYEAVTEVTKKAVRQRKKLEASNDTTTTITNPDIVTTTALPAPSTSTITTRRKKSKLTAESSTTTVSKPRAKRATSSQLVKDEASSADALPATVKPRKKRGANKESAEEAVPAQVAAVATKIKRASKSSKKASSPAEAAPEPPAEVIAPIKTHLRPYQQECIDACLQNLKEGKMRQIVSLPVGSGKTVIFSHLMKQVPAPFPGANKILVLAHRQELLEQTRNHVLRNGTGLKVTIDQGKRLADMSADVIVASVPSLGRAGTPRLLKYNPQEFKCIIIDEAHHAAAESYGRILHHFGADVPNTHIFVYGCSATVRRHDGLKLGGVFDYISFHKGFITMIEDKWLCGLRVSTIKTDFDLRDVKMQGGDFATKDLAVKVNTDIRNDIVVRSYMTYCAARKSTVVFAVDIAHLESLTESFRQYGYDARGLSSKTNDFERAQMLQDFRDQKFPIIVNCGILTEGTDIPVIDAIVMARPTKSNVLFQQMLGRGMRLHPGKEDCLVLDFVDVVRGEGLVTLPTLLGLDTEAVLHDDVTIKSHGDVDAIRKEQMGALEDEAKSESEFPEETETVETVDPLTGVKVARIRVLEYENPYQLIGDGSGANKNVWAMSQNAWVNVGAGAYVLTCQEITFRIEKSAEDGLYRCYKRTILDDRRDEEEGQTVPPWQRRFRRKKKPVADGGKYSIIRTKENMLPIESDTLEDCFHGVDTWIGKNIGHFPGVLGRFAEWRKKPASESQLKFLRKLGYDHDPLEDVGGDSSGDGNGDDEGGNGIGSRLTMEEEEVKRRKRRESMKQLTKGQAANMITRLVNGAGKRWAESKKFQVKRAKALANEIAVDVGPISKYVDI